MQRRLFSTSIAEQQNKIAHFARKDAAAMHPLIGEWRLASWLEIEFVYYKCVNGKLIDARPFLTKFLTIKPTLNHHSQVFLNIVGFLRSTKVVESQV